MLILLIAAYRLIRRGIEAASGCQVSSRPIRQSHGTYILQLYKVRH